MTGPNAVQLGSHFLQQTTTQKRDMPLSSYEAIIPESTKFSFVRHIPRVLQMTVGNIIMKRPWWWKEGRGVECMFGI